MKVCRVCEIPKPLSEFYRHSAGGLRGLCKRCHYLETKAWKEANPDKLQAIARRARLKARFGVTEAQYLSLLNQQGGRCAICRLPESRERLLSVDHDHSCCSGRTSCGKCVRGLLCSTCNLNLAWYEEYAERATAYLIQKHELARAKRADGDGSVS
jgi:hypothetical protein